MAGRVPNGCTAGLAVRYFSTVIALAGGTLAGMIDDLDDAGPDPLRPPFDASRLVRAESVGPPNVFECPRCGRVSYHPADVAFGYCGRCHDWTGDQ